MVCCVTDESRELNPGLLSDERKPGMEPETHRDTRRYEQRHTETHTHTHTHTHTQTQKHSREHTHTHTHTHLDYIWRMTSLATNQSLRQPIGPSTWKQILQRAAHSCTQLGNLCRVHVCFCRARVLITLQWHRASAGRVRGATSPNFIAISFSKSQSSVKKLVGS